MHWPSMYLGVHVFFEHRRAGNSPASLSFDQQENTVIEAGNGKLCAPGIRPLLRQESNLAPALAADLPVGGIRISTVLLFLRDVPHQICYFATPAPKVVDGNGCLWYRSMLIATRDTKLTTICTILSKHCSTLDSHRRAIIAAGESVDGPSPAQMSEWTNSIDRLTRWNVFLTHVNVNCHGVVDTIEKHPETPREPLNRIALTISHVSTTVSAQSMTLSWHPRGVDPDEKLTGDDPNEYGPTNTSDDWTNGFITLVAVDIDNKPDSSLVRVLQSARRRDPAIITASPAYFQRPHPENERVPVRNRKGSLSQNVLAEP
ncbi:hypothetical protein V8E54_008564 [Elaphomyces granulatus]